MRPLLQGLTTSEGLVHEGQGRGDLVIRVLRKGERSREPRAEFIWQQEDWVKHPEPGDIPQIPSEDGQGEKQETGTLETVYSIDLYGLPAAMAPCPSNLHLKTPLGFTV